MCALHIVLHLCTRMRKIMDYFCNLICRLEHYKCPDNQFIVSHAISRKLLHISDARDIQIQAPKTAAYYISPIEIGVL